MIEAPPPADVAELVNRLEGPHEWGYRDIGDGKFIDDDAPLVAASALSRLSSALDKIIAYAEECKKKAHEDVNASFSSTYRYHEKLGAIRNAEGAEACAEIARAAFGKEHGT